MSRTLLLFKLLSLRAPKGRSNLAFKIASVASLPRNDTFKFVLILFLSLVLGQGFVALAKEDTTANLLNRPIVEYDSGKSRDPFKSYIAKEELTPAVALDKVDVNAPEFDLSKLKVQGIIWGGSFPQAIINDKVLRINDLIEGAQILSIAKNGITLSFNGAVYDLAAPDKNSIPTQVNEEDKK